MGIAKPNFLYVFGGEKAQGAEIVVERLMNFNSEKVNIHLFIAPGKFADQLISSNKPYKINLSDHLRKLNRSTGGKIDYYFKALSNYFSLSYSINKYIRKHNISVVHANTVVPASYLLPLIMYSRMFNKKLRWLWSDHDLSNYSGLDSKLSKICADKYDITLAVSNAVKDKYISNDNVKVLYNGLDTEAFKKDTVARVKYRKALKISKDDIVIGMPAIVHPRKGQLKLIEAFSKIGYYNSNVLLLLSGGFENSTPEYSESVRNAIADNENVIHLGYLSDMTEFYNGCDIIINNSDLQGSEPLGTTIYEAMACEKVVIAAETGGTPEIVTDKVDGYLFTANDVEQLTEKLDFVIQNYWALDHIRIEAREKVKKKFNIKVMVPNYNGLVGIS